ncbi:MAG: hypothetical protein V7K25_08330 [Nostoc sp.]|uniref:hypothetical protein n=1 Tax=Nostoc sp. TaxID=1180 RepID=UPI002FFCC6DD
MSLITRRSASALSLSSLRLTILREPILKAYMSDVLPLFKPPKELLCMPSNFNTPSTPIKLLPIVFSDAGRSSAGLFGVT